MRLPWQRKAVTPADAVSSSVGIATSRRSYEGWYTSAFANYVPLTVDFGVYDAIREGIPFVDAAIRKLARKCGGFGVGSDNEGAAEQANEWLQSVRCFGVCSGFETFSFSYISGLLQYGHNAAEVVLSQSGRDIYQLVTASPYKLRLIGVQGETLLGEANAAGQVTPYARQDLFGYSAMNVEKDNPHGVSILRSLPFTTNIAMVMQNSLRQRWMRSGAPAFLLLDKLNPGIPIDDATAGKRQEKLASEWNTAMKKRWDQDGITDFAISTQGDFSVNPIETAAGFDFPADLRAMEEQIVSAVELAPFMLGLQWSTTERLSQQQADEIVTFIERVRGEVEPAYMRILDWWARTNGISAPLYPVWEPVSLQDRVETANAEKVAAEAQRTRADTARIWWANGWVNQTEAAEVAGVELQQPVVALQEPVFPEKVTPGLPTGADGAAKAAWGKYPG